MRWFWLVVIVGLATLFWANSWVTTHIFPNTYLNEQPLGLKSKNAVIRWLGVFQKPKMRIKVGERVYTFEYADLGIIFDLNKTFKELTKENELTFPQNLVVFVKSFKQKKTVLPEIVFSQEYYERVEKLQFNFATTDDKVSINPKAKTLVYENYQELLVIDPRSLSREIVVNFGKRAVLKPLIHRVIDGLKSLKIADYNQCLGQIFAQPVQLYSENGAEAIGKIAVSELRSVLSVSYDAQNEWLSVGVEQTALRRLTESLTFNLGKDLRVDRIEFEEQLVSLINSRFNGYPVNSVIVSFSEAPNTEGEVAEKYIEIDLSQQKMYLWESGENVAVHRVSSGLYYATPPGHYQILNKANNAYSYIYHVWMPYWMAFSLDPKVNAYLGIHELPYWVDSGGQEIRRPRDFIGSPHTGGCVSLDVGEAELVYNWAEVGTPVWIFE